MQKTLQRLRRFSGQTRRCSQVQRRRVAAQAMPTKVDESDRRRR